MNERIKQLMGQALDEKFAGTWSAMDLQDLAKFADRFAELIVEECAGVCEDYRGTEWGKAAECIGDSIKEHFGVEE